MKAKIIITGASGFVGKNIVDYLGNQNVECLDRLQLQHLNSSTLQNAAAVVHLAGKAHDIKNVGNPDDYYTVNFELTKELYNAFLQSDAKKFIFISSVKAVADTVDGVLTEAIIPSPQTHYGKSKLMAEEYIIAQQLPANKFYYILRPSMIHGPGNKGNLNLLYQVVKRDIPYPFAAFQNKRTFLSVKNLCFVIKELIDQKEIPSGVYHIADDESLSTTDVVRVLAQSMGKKPKLWKISKSLISSIARVGNWLRLPLNTERLYKLTGDYVVSNLKIMQALNVKLPVKAKEGLIETANSLSNPKKDNER
ncbi:NAD-dependent epimerase/dehydratase family protein [Pedobacter chinensis]|uniref:NAD-dependent epimerase/dehydratase family protein n=1 Tax=Pedobacter chinensis TaxID=2282421 RepID=A0A369PPQ1_9SPHI|nr:NAD-dependent epimerase/dehydratase family protein [Pedobacter chinensis]RDC54250.1 NAD-dependent epimerase/dehydratase family protein [Pedobacter chinensis]